MKRLYPLKQHVRKGVDPLPLKTPQLSGRPGWILLTHDEEGSPVSLFVDSEDRVIPIPVVLDERLFSDTVIRATQLRTSVFLVSDLRYLNGKFVYETMNYEERRAKLGQLIDMFHSPDLTALLTHDEVPSNIPVRGWEHYDDKPGSLGVFLPAVE
jgi:hypothetical protein